MKNAPTIVVTQAQGGTGPLAAALEERGAEVLAVPTTATLAPDDTRPLDDALARLDSFDWLVFTSARAVEATFARPQGIVLPSSRLQIGAVGEATAQCLRHFHHEADSLPSPAGGAELAAAICASSAPRPGARGPQDLRVLWPRAENARPELREILVGAGAVVVDPVAYKTVPASGKGIAEFLLRLDAHEIDAVAFMSPSSARHLAAALGDPDLKRIAALTRIASIGPTTSAALQELGAPALIEAEERSAEGLARALISSFSTQGVTR